MEPIQKAVRKAVASGVATGADFSSLEESTLDALVADLLGEQLPPNAPSILKVAKILDCVLALREAQGSKESDG